MARVVRLVLNLPDLLCAKIHWNASFVILEPTLGRGGHIRSRVLAWVYDIPRFRPEKQDKRPPPSLDVRNSPISLLAKNCCFGNTPCNSTFSQTDYSHTKVPVNVQGRLFEGIFSSEFAAKRLKDRTNNPPYKPRETIRNIHQLFYLESFPTDDNNLFHDKVEDDTTATISAQAYCAKVANFKLKREGSLSWIQNNLW